jgi:hypothetical protein
MNFRTVALGSAAVLASGLTARAADLPTVEPVEYVRICDAFGTGFFYIPGTDTCLKLGGYVRAESHYVDGDLGVLRGDVGNDHNFNNWTSRARGNVQFDAQTQSALGLIRTFIELETTLGPDDYTEDGVSDGYSSTMELPYAFIQISNDRGMFTFGRTDSFFDFWGSDDYGTRVDIDDNTTEQTLFAYTLNGPNGLTGTLSIEDPRSAGRLIDGADDYEGEELPDFVGNIRLDKDWGSAQIMGVVRRIHDKEGGGPDDSGDDEDGIGWAAGGGATVNLPVGGLGFSTQVGYADGALAYITTDPGGIGDISGPSGDDTNQGWVVRAGLTAPLGDKISTWFDGSFTHAEDDVDDDRYNYWAFVVGAAWKPTDKLSMGPEFGYNNIDGDDPGEKGDLWGLMWRMESMF